MDDKSLEILEFPAVRKIIAGYTSFPAGYELTLELKPSPDFEEVTRLLRQAGEARQLLSVDAVPSIGGASDIREEVGRAARGKVVEPLSLVEIQQTLAVLRQVRDSLENKVSEAPELWQIAKNITGFPGVEKEIGRCLSPGGEVLDRASQKLASIRRRLISSRQDLHQRLDEIIRTPKWQKIIQEPIITEREGRYVIPVKTEFRRDMEGITHDISNTGATVFVEPLAAIDLGNTIRELAIEERHEVERILQELSGKVGSYEAEISVGVLCLAELDMIIAKARYAREVKAAEPNLIKFAAVSGKGASGAFIRLVEARHPLLGKKAVPLTVEIGRDFSGLVITGPNTGGKTVALKTIGLLSLMAQAGIPVPAAPETCLPVFDAIFADIGDEQSIEQTLSSFSWHMNNTVRIIDNTTGQSLVLLDELGTSTDPAEGSALARAILLHFLSQKTLTVATTHYADLKAFAHNTPGIQNASFDFDPDTLVPTYHMTLGIPGGSNALVTAGRLGIPPSIIDQARTMLSKGALDLDAALADIMAEKQKISGAGELLEKERESVNAQNAEIKNRLAKLRAEERGSIDEARDSIIREAAELNRQVRKASAELRRKTTRETVEAARNTLAAMKSRLDSQEWTPETPPEETGQSIRTGDTVTLREFGLRATVLAISEKKGEVEVQAGQTRITVGINNVEKVSGAPLTRGGGKTIPVLPPAAPVPATLDLRGKRADEVEVAVDMYLSDAALTNLNEVVIIHGFGTGTVRQIVRDFLSGHPLVKSFRAGGKGEGGDGATVVSL